MKISYQMRYTLGFIALQALLISGVYHWSGNPMHYHLAAYSAISAVILVSIGALVGPFLFATGVLKKNEPYWHCGLILVVFNSVPAGLFLAISCMLEF